MLVVIDRFEKEMAICQKEDKTMITISKKELPKEAKEGNILKIEDSGITIDQEATIARRKYIQDLFDRL